jgi:hypothetical protein
MGCMDMNPYVSSLTKNFVSIRPNQSQMPARYISRFALPALIRIDFGAVCQIDFPIGLHLRKSCSDLSRFCRSLYFLDP